MVDDAKAILARGTGGGDDRYHVYRVLRQMVEEVEVTRAVLRALADRVVLLDNQHDEGISASDATVIAAYALLQKGN